MTVARHPHPFSGHVRKRRCAASAVVTLIAAFVVLAMPNTASAAIPFYCDDTGCYAYVDGAYVRVGDPVIPPDVDGDGYVNTADNCPSISNPTQLNSDTDEQGNACDADDDGDNVLDANDACPTVAGNGADGCPPPTLPTTANDCKKNGWQNYSGKFKNQGDCVSFVASAGRNAPTG